MPRFGGPGKKKKRCIKRTCNGSQPGEVLSNITNTSSVKRPHSKAQPKTSSVKSPHSKYTTEEIIKVSVIGILDEAIAYIELF